MLPVFSMFISEWSYFKTLPATLEVRGQALIVSEGSYILSLLIWAGLETAMSCLYDILMVAASFHLPSVRFTMRTQLVESSHCYIHHLFDQPIGVTIVLWQGHDVSLFPLANNANLQTKVSQEASVLLNNESLRLCWREALSNTSVIVSHMVRWRPWKRLVPKQKSFITFPCKWTKPTNHQIPSL